MKFSEFLGSVSAKPPVRQLRGLFSAHVAYPVAERMERRHIRGKVADLRRHYARPFSERLALAQRRTHEIVAYAGAQVPYYRDLFKRIGFDPAKLASDPRYLQDLPYLDKEIIRAEGERLLSDELKGGPRHERKTGGSTGLSCMIYYDQEGLDHSAAVVLYAREAVGHTRSRSELHFACRFPDAQPGRWPTREDLKPPTLRIVPEPGASEEQIRQRIEQFWPEGFLVEFVSADDFVRVGRHQKFRHLVHP